MDDSILVTLGQSTIKDRKGGYKLIAKEWLNADGEQDTWWYRCGNAPKREVVYVYWVIGGRIRWRSRLLDIHKDITMTFDNQTEAKYAKAWLVLYDFETIPRQLQTIRKGFKQAPKV